MEQSGRYRRILRGRPQRYHSVGRLIYDGIYHSETSIPWAETACAGTTIWITPDILPCAQWIVLPAGGQGRCLSGGKRSSKGRALSSIGDPVHVPDLCGQATRIGFSRQWCRIFQGESYPEPCLTKAIVHRSKARHRCSWLCFGASYLCI